LAYEKTIKTVYKHKTWGILMRTAGIISNNFNRLLEAFNRMPYETLRLVDAAGGTMPQMDVLIVQDAKPALIKSVRMLPDSAYLILNTDKREILPLLPAGREVYKLITYGFNGKACVTASSTMDGMLQACVQRGFVTLDGNLREPCEFGLPATGDCGDMLGLTAALLVCGIISRLTFNRQKLLG
jgi:hypothetical protein